MTVLLTIAWLIALATVLACVVVMAPQAPRVYVLPAAGATVVASVVAVIADVEISAGVVALALAVAAGAAVFGWWARSLVPAGSEFVIATTLASVAMLLLVLGAASVIDEGDSSTSMSIALALVGLAGGLSGGLLLQKLDRIVMPRQAIFALPVAVVLLAVCLVLEIGSDRWWQVVGIVVGAVVTGFVCGAFSDWADRLIICLVALSGLVLAGLAVARVFELVPLFLVLGVVLGAVASLTHRMSLARGRSIPGCLVGGLRAERKDHAVRTMSVSDAALALADPQRVVFVPGFGLAACQGQHLGAELAGLFKERGAEVSWAIHPIAGRIPGHMNLILDDARIDHESQRELPEAQTDINEADLVVVLGANDVFNPIARTDEPSALRGLDVFDLAGVPQVLVLNNDVGSGFAGLPNAQLLAENTVVIAGSVDRTIVQLIEEFRRQTTP